MVTLDPRLTEILEGIIQAYDAPPAEHRQRLLYLSLEETGFLQVSQEVWGERPRATRDDLDDLADYGFIDIDYSKKQANYLVKPSPEGRRAVEELHRERALAARSQAIDLSWAAVRPVLRAAVDEWERTGASGNGVPAEVIATALGGDVDLQLIRSLQQLEADEFIAAEWAAGQEAPIAVRPLSKAYVGTRGWPGGDDAATAERLVAALDDLAQSDDERSGWAARARDVFSEVTSKTMAEVIFRAGMGG